MLRRSLLALFVLLGLLLPPAFAIGQQATPAPAPAAGNPDLEISWPQPISEVYGLIDIVGTANIKGMAFYRLEAIELDADNTVPENAAWIPLTTDLTTPVVNNVLAQVDTTKLADGVFELRMSAFTGTVETPGKESAVTTGPIRVNNANDTGTGVLPTPGPTATPMAKNAAPVVVPAYPGTGGVNVRLCTIADNNACPVQSVIADGQSATLLGIANDGSGWYLVGLPSGVTGWVSGTVATVVGGTTGIPQVTPPAPLPPVPPPPAPPAAPTGQPTAPPSYGPVIPNGIGIQNGVKPGCNQPFNVEVNVYNSGNAQSPAGTVTLQDVHVDDGTVTFTGYGSYPALNPGQNYVVVIPATISTYVGSKHELRASNGYQQQVYRYTLGTGSCGGPAPTATPPPPPGPTPTPKPAKQCIIQTKDDTKYYDKPMGKRLGYLPAQSIAPVNYQRANGIRWYQVNYNGQLVWVLERELANVPNACKNF